MKKEEILSNLRLAKSYINDILIELSEKSNWNSTSFDNEDIEISKKVYQIAVDAKNKIIFDDAIPLF